MKPLSARSSSLSRLLRGGMTGLLCLAAGASALAADEPAQKPLLSSQSGAKPNLMLTFDNSGSMAFPYHEAYNVTDDREGNGQICPRPYSNQNSTNAATFNSGVDGVVTLSGGRYTCYQWSEGWVWRGRRGWQWEVSVTPRTDVSVAVNASNWLAQRSSDVNPLYYNPRITYKARVDSRGRDLPDDGLQFVSNQNSVNFIYRVFHRTDDDQVMRYHSMLPSETNAGSALLNNDPADPPLTGFTNIYNLAGTAYPYRIPTHLTYPNPRTSPATGAPNSTTPAFTYAYCSNVTTDAQNRVTGCAGGAATRVDVTFGSSASIPLPAGHQRTEKECTASSCPTATEITNILNWYRYYSNRNKAAATAMGQALAKSDYNNKLRLGYLNISRRNGATISNITQPGDTTEDPNFSRGVRQHVQGGADTTQLYNWLYNHEVVGGTPLHNSIDRVAAYYQTASPWAKDPTSATSPEVTCRRSFNLLFSDGEWNSGTSTLASTAANDFDNKDGPTFNGTVDGVAVSFDYKPTGDNTSADGRKKYTPYPGKGLGGLADLTAQYYWHTDLRDSLANEIRTRNGQPAFWQNMATYTIGYLIRPRGELPGATSGLTFQQIRNYEASYKATGTTIPSPTWPTGDINTSANGQDRIDDFIQAGFTGGGTGTSVRTAEEVRAAVDAVLSDVVGGSGQDAGVAVSAASTSNLEGSLKYKVSYKTFDNSGDVTAEQLKADGTVDKEAWKASEKQPKPEDRKVFTRSDDASATGPTEFKGKVKDLPETVQAALIGTDTTLIDTDSSNFVDYLRGKDPVNDKTGQPFRERSSKLGAMVNPPSVYMGGSRDFAYDLVGNVSGNTKYKDYILLKQTLPASLLVATNAGMVHDLDATTGDELAAFMPRRSLKRMLAYAKKDYTFEFTVDGPLSEHDIYDGTEWNHIAVGTGGRGERLIYALRVPLNESSKDRIPDKADFLWEVGPTGGPTKVGDTSETDTINNTDFKLGHITNPTHSGQTADIEDVATGTTINGKWVVVVNSGHYNGTTDGSKHGLLVLDAMTGATLKRIPLPAAYDAGRGLSGVTLVRNNDNRVVAAYAGDANGNLWRFSLLGQPDDWKVSYDQPLFTTKGNRPIYGAPAWQVHPKKGTIVVFGTGILLEVDDAKDTSADEAIYGIWDPTEIGEADKSPFTTVGLSELLEQSIDTGVAGVNKTGTDRTYYQSTSEKIDWKVSATEGSHRGWTFPLKEASEGERSIDQVRNLGTSVFINTLVIDDYKDIEEESCDLPEARKNFVYGLRALDGAAAKSFDSDGDGKANDVSVLEIVNGGFDRGLAVIPPPVDKGSDSQRIYYSPDTNSGESLPPGSGGAGNCKGDPHQAQGAADDPEKFFPGCSTPGGWKRTQYQLSAPPAK